MKRRSLILAPLALTAGLALAGCSKATLKTSETGPGTAPSAAATNIATENSATENTATRELFPDVLKTELTPTGDEFAVSRSAATAATPLP